MNILSDFQTFDVGSVLQEIDSRDSDALVDEAEARGEVERRKAEVRKQRYAAKKTLQLADFKDVGFPKAGEMFCILSVGSFNAYTMILAAVEQFGVVDDLKVTTFNMHQDVITGLFDFFDNKTIDTLDVILSESVKFRMPKRYNQMIAEHKKRCKSGRLRVKYNWNHSKIILIPAGDNKICITGSGNLSNNAQFEQYYITNCCNDFDFFANWIDKQFEGEFMKREVILNGTSEN